MATEKEWSFDADSAVPVEQQTPAEATEGFQFDAESAVPVSQSVSPPKPKEEPGFGEKAQNTLAGLYGGVTRGITKELPAQIGEMWQAGRPVHEGEETWADRKAKEAEEARVLAERDTSPTLLGTTAGKMSSEIAQNVPQIATNLGGMAAGALAGATEGSVLGPLGAAGGGVLGAAASLLPMYEQTKTTAAKQNLVGLEAKKGTPLSLQEKLKAQEEMQPDVAKTAAWEVVTELPGTVLETLPIVGPWAKAGAGKLIRSGLSKAALKEFGLGAGKAALATMATEPLEETVSQIGERELQNKYQPAGNQQPALSFERPEDYITAYKEVVGPTLRGMLPMTILGALTGGAGRYHAGRQLAQTHEALQKFDPNATDNLGDLRGAATSGQQLIDSGALKGTDTTWLADKVVTASERFEQQKAAQLEAFNAYVPDTNLQSLAVAGIQGSGLIQSGAIPKAEIGSAVGKVKAIKANMLQAFNDFDPATSNNAGDLLAATTIGNGLIKEKAVGAEAKKKVADAAAKFDTIVKAKLAEPAAVLTEAAKHVEAPVTPVAEEAPAVASTPPVATEAPAEKVEPAQPLIAHLDEGAAKLEQEAAKVAAKKYKPNKTILHYEGGDITIEEANERKRQAKLQNLAERRDSLQKAKDAIAKNPEKFAVAIKKAQSEAATMEGNLTDREKTAFAFRNFNPVIKDLAVSGRLSELIEPKAPTIATAVDLGAHQAATSPLNEIAEPTPEQAKEGKYKKGRVVVAGIPIDIENPQGSERKGVDADGKPWSVKMQDHYGEILGVRGNDKDYIDAFIKPGTPESYDGEVFVVDQKQPDNGRFDEHKIMIGFDSVEEAKEGYLRNYAPGWDGIQHITPMRMDQFKDWLQNGDTTKPVTEHAIEEPSTATPYEGGSTQPGVRGEGRDTTVSGAGLRESGQEKTTSQAEKVTDLYQNLLACYRKK